MNTSRNRNDSKEVSDIEVEATLHAVLRDDGLLIPDHIDEISSLEKSLDLTGVPTPDSNKFRQLLKQETSSKDSDKVTHLFGPCQTVPADIRENLAMAARNGGFITEDIRKK